MKATCPLLITAAFCCAVAHADIVYTNPMGYVKISCLPNSDTIVGLPLRQAADFTGTLASNPAGAVLSLTGTPGLVANQFAGTHYVKFKDSQPAAAGDGQWFKITANDASSITVDLNGDSVLALAGAELEVLKFWTLAELFPPDQTTSNPATTGTAIVETVDPFNQMTQILIPNYTGQGTNLSASATYYLYSGGWRKFGQNPTIDAGADPLWPDAYFIIRHTSAVTGPTTYMVSGECEMGGMVIPLSTRTNGQQDNLVAVPRGVDVTLDGLELAESGAFTATTDPFDLQDLLLVYDNTTTATNRSASATYYHYNGAWRKFGQSPVSNFGGDVIKAGEGLLIRKAQTVDGATHFWDNPANY